MNRRALIATLLAILILAGFTLGFEWSNRRPIEPVVVATCGAGRLERWGPTDVVFLVGAPYERGYQQGTLLRKKVRLVAGLIGGDSAKWAGAAVRVGELVRTLRPDELEEMQGIADGAGVALELILDINLAYEVDPILGCSQFAATDATGTLAVGRNLEYFYAETLAQGRVLQVVVPQEGEPYFAPSLAGMAGILTAINRSGIYVAYNAIGGAEQSPTGIPVMFALRRVALETRTFAEAIAALRASPAAKGYVALLVSGNERLMTVVEAAVSCWGTVLPQNSFIALTNHYMLPDTAATVSNRDDGHQTTLEQGLRSAEVMDATTGIQLLTSVAATSPSRDPRASVYALHSLVWLPGTDEVWLSDNGLPSTSGRFICFHPLQMLTAATPTR